MIKSIIDETTIAQDEEKIKSLQELRSLMVGTLYVGIVSGDIHKLILQLEDKKRRLAEEFRSYRYSATPILEMYYQLEKQKTSAQSGKSG